MKKKAKAANLSIRPADAGSAKSMKKKAAKYRSG